MNAGGHGRLQNGGAERAVVELVNSLSQSRGVQIVVAGPPEYLETAGFLPVVKLIRFDPYSRPIRRLSQILGEERPDVVVTHLLRSTLLAQPLALLHRVPHRVNVLHNSLTRTFEADAPPIWRRAIYRAAFLAIGRWISHLSIAISEPNANDLVDCDHIPRERIMLIPNWVPPGFMEEVRQPANLLIAETGLDTESPLVGVVGRLEPQKGQDFLISLLPKLPRVQLVILGEGDLRGELEELVQALGISERVRFLGFRKDVADWMAACDVIAVPSVYEGFGRVAVEALAVGTAVVANNVDGLGAILTEAPRGAVWLVKRHSRTGWLEAMNEALSTTNREVDRAQRAAFVGELYSFDAAMSRYRDALGIHP